jgi:hypothetical protein
MRYTSFLKYLSESRLQQSDGLPYWRERIFNGILLAIFVFGTLAIFPNLIAALKARMYPIFILDSFIFLTVLAVVFVRKIGLTVKIYILIFSFYLLGIFLLVTMGPFGPGMIWIVCCSVLIALMLDFKKTLFSCFPHFSKKPSERPDFTEMNFENGCPICNFEHVCAQEVKFIG